MHKAFIALLFCYLMVGCDEQWSYDCQFDNSDMVVSILSGQQGQIISIYPKYAPNDNWRDRTTCMYDVRFEASQTKFDATISRDEDPMMVLPLAVVKRMRPYELRLK